MAARAVRLHEDEQTRSIECEQMEARLMRRCSVCERTVDHPSQLDASARCVECQP